MNILLPILWIFTGPLFGFAIGQWYGNRKALRELHGIMEMARYNAHFDPRYQDKKQN